MRSDPKTIGRYEVIRVLGHGAMGVVYLAFDPLLKRPLAIKTVRDSGVGARPSLTRFQREAEISARLNHPNIVTVHDVGEDPESGPFLAMEFIDGLPLSELIQQGIPTESVIHLLLQGMSALQAAERAGITHRDVKPANILVSHDGRLKLMDFGIARGEGSRLTQTGQIFGTPSYTAPEALGGIEPSSVTDRYAFAVTAFQMITCVLPFECATIAATLFRIVHEAPLFPDTLSPELRGVFAKALNKLPAERYPDLASFMRDLITAVDLPAETKAKFLATLSRDPGAEVAQLIKVRAEESASFSQDLETLATPAAPRATPRLPTEELATEAFRTPRPGTSLRRPPEPAPTATARPETAGPEPAPPESGRMETGLPQPAPPEPPAPRKRRFGWPVWAAASLLTVGILGAGAWMTRVSYFLVEVTSVPPGAALLLNGQPFGMTDLAQARIPRGGGTLRFEKTGYEPKELQVHQGDGSVHVVLSRPAFMVRVVTAPPGADAFLNGVPMGSTPIAGLQVPGEGRQELVLRLRDRRDWSMVLDPDVSLPEVIRLEHLQAAPARSAPPVPAPAPAVVAGGARMEPPAPAPVAQAAAERPAAPVVNPEPPPALKKAPAAISRHPVEERTH